MAKKLMTLVFVMGLLSQTGLSWGENYDFRLTRWGMTQNEVVTAEEKMIGRFCSLQPSTICCLQSVCISPER